MALAPAYNPSILGSFKETEHNNKFEYTNTRTPIFYQNLAYDKLVYVGFNGEYRYARIMKTIAYIIVDELDCNQYVVEKWNIKQHITY